MVGGLRRFAVLVTFALALLLPLPSHAFCGFYVNTGDQPLFNEATRVALLRVGMRTVMSIQNDYQGPIDDFALVIPVPIVLERENVRTLSHSVFDRVDRLTSPRLVEYWEQDPCAYERDYDREGGTGTRAKGEEGSMGSPNTKKLVVVEREFKVDEYDVVILSARDSGALETWLHENNYKIPAGAEPYFRPYVQDGSKFFVAKVDVNRVHFRWNRAQLSPLRFHYDTPEFKLPIRLGLINSSGVQDLLVYILGEQRYETANYENLFIPTNLDLKEEARSKFNTFYAALFDQTLAKQPRAVVTEYSWSPESCDPCPEGAGPLAPADAQLLGLDVIKPLPSQMVLTRLHARYGKDSIGDDLVFRTATPVVGGREYRQNGALSHSAETSGANNFQGRYIIRHPWTEPVECSAPRYGVWGGPPYGAPPPANPKPNPLASRKLEVNDYILDEKASARGPGEGPTLRGIRIGNTTYDWHPLVGLRHVLDVSSWNSEERGIGFFSAWGVSFVGALIWARRRRTGVLKTLGLFVGFGALALFIAAESMAPHDHLLRDSSFRYFGREALLFIATALMVAGLAAGRTTLRTLWAFAPVTAGLFRAAQEKAYLAELFRTDLIDAPLDQFARIHAESTAEAFQPILIGAALSGVFVVLALVLGHQRREGVKWHYAFGAFAIAAIARNLLVERNGVDLIALVVFAGAAFLMTRARGFNTLLGAATGVLLLDIASKLFVTSEGLGAVSSESIDQAQISRILEVTIHFENRHLLVAALDIGLLVGLVTTSKAPVGFVDWRTATGAAAVIVLSATPFEWYGSRNAFGSLDPLRAHTTSLTGPTLFARGNQLLARPSADVEPEPYSPRVADKMARADAGSAPLLVARAEDPFATLLDALAPLLRVRQYDYRLIEGLDPPRELGLYGPLVSARRAEAVPVDILPKLDVRGLRSLLAIRWDGQRVSVRVPDNPKFGVKTLLSRNTAGWWTADGEIKMLGIREGTLAVPRETSLSTIHGLLERLGNLELTRLALSPDVAALDEL